MYASLKFPSYSYQFLSNLILFKSLTNYPLPPTGLFKATSNIILFYYRFSIFFLKEKWPLKTRTTITLSHRKMYSNFLIVSNPVGVEISPIVFTYVYIKQRNKYLQQFQYTLRIIAQIYCSIWGCKTVIFYHFFFIYSLEFIIWNSS